MTEYFWLKTLHIISATVLMGTGTGIAFFMLMAVRSGQQQVIHRVSKIVIIADWLFTAPAVVVQLLTGLRLVSVVNYSYTAPWFLWTAVLFVLVGCCWLPVIWIQYQLHHLSASETSLVSRRFRMLMRFWIALGVPAFVAMIAIFWLMVAKPVAVI